MAARSSATSVSSFIDAIGNELYRYLAYQSTLALQAERNLRVSPDKQPLSDFEKIADQGRNPKILPPTKPTPGIPAAEGDARGAIDKDHPLFARAVRLVQQDISKLITVKYKVKKFDAYPYLDRLLSAEPETLNQEYQTISQAWDCLIACKKKLTVQDDHEFQVGAWFVNLISETERLLRTTVVLAIFHCGQTTLKDVLVSSVKELDLVIGLDHVIEAETTAEALSGAFLTHMQQSGKATLTIAEQLAECVGCPFMEDEPGFENGALELLSWLCPPKTPDGDSRTRATMETLMEWRHDVIHPAASDGARRVDNVELFERTAPSELAQLAELAAGIALRFSIDVIKAIVKRAKVKMSSASEKRAVEESEYKLTAEFRVLHMDVLKNDLWILAWIMGEAVVGVGDPERDLMPRMNVFYARSQFDQFRDDAVRDVNAMDLSGASPRYELIRRSITKEWKGVPALLDAAIDSLDMSLSELAQWPALETLRRTKRSGYSIWLARRFPDQDKG